MTLPEDVPEVRILSGRDCINGDPRSLYAIDSIAREATMIDMPLDDDSTSFVEDSKEPSSIIIQNGVSLLAKKEAGEPPPPTHTIPKLYFCATLWHENLIEMTQLIKSVCKVDVYNYTKKRAANNVYATDHVNFFDFEVHIMFDDSIMKTMDNHNYDFDNVTEDGETPQDIKETKPLVGQKASYKVNPFVKQLITAVNDACIEVYGAYTPLKTPMKTLTPYGGRLTWQLPCGTEIQVHLKNIALIRNKKRWSQVMYFFYTLGFRHAKIASELKTLSLSDAVNLYQLDKTFVLALDGDVYFEPESVFTLLDGLAKRPKSAAVCGRLVPIGYGPISWYQRYEYCAIHWFEKTAEVILGCVLCCPGTLTLFRGSAIADKNVGYQYTKTATKPSEVIQCDLGEDRWLSIMLIEQGHKIEYRPDVDIYTYMPVGFDEFFNQRRRWLASTWANTSEFILKSRSIMKTNSAVHFFYVLYQIIAMLSMWIGPSTILLMFIWIATANLHLPLYASIILNFVPVIIFVALAFFTKPKKQLMFAKAVALLYVMAMLIITSRTYYLLQHIQSGSFRDPFTLLFVSLTGMTFLTALLHPYELKNMIFWPVYTIYIPTMCLLLITYTMCNLHLPTWGTREVIKDQLEVASKKKSRFRRFLDKFTKGSKKSSEKTKPNQANDSCHCKTKSSSNQCNGKCNDGAADTTKNGQKFSLSVIKTDLNDKKRNRYAQDSISDNAPEWQKSNWMKDEELLDLPVGKLDNEEISFWESLISEYLSPKVYEEAKKQEIARGLKKLRNIVAFSYIFLNLCVIGGIITLQLYKPYLEGLWKRTAIGGYLNFEPLTYALVIYIFTFTVQFLAMLIDRAQVGCKLVYNSITQIFGGFFKKI